jgi:hypothetical protein
MLYFSNEDNKMVDMLASDLADKDNIIGGMLGLTLLKTRLSDCMAGKVDVEDMTVLLETLQNVTEHVMAAKARAYDKTRM